MNFKVGQKVKCIRADNAHWVGTHYTSTNDYYVGDILTIKKILTNGKFLNFGTNSCRYNPKCFTPVGQMSWRERYGR